MTREMNWVPPRSGLTGRHSNAVDQSAVVEAFEAVKNHLRTKTAPDALLVDVLLLCTRCREPIKACINTPNWLRVEWIGPEGECLKCFQETKKEVTDGGECCHFQD